MSTLEIHTLTEMDTASLPLRFHMHLPQRLSPNGSGRSPSETRVPSSPVQGSSSEAAARVLRGRSEHGPAPQLQGAQPLGGVSPASVLAPRLSLCSLQGPDPNVAPVAPAQS